MSLTLVTGGCRSGKSRYAQAISEEMSKLRFFLATCPAIDEEMQVRIQHHQADRDNSGWQTIEVERDLTTVISKLPGGGVVLLDCLTLWINNIMYQAEQEKVAFNEEDFILETNQLIKTCIAYDGDVVVVTNELGWGIVPENELSRYFRDVAGRCNISFAKAANEVNLMVCGIATKIKP